MTETQPHNRRRDLLLASIDNSLIWIFWVIVLGTASTLILLGVFGEKMHNLIEVLTK